MSAPSRWTDGAANGPREQAAAELLRAAAKVSPSSPEQLAALLQGAKARALLRTPWAWLKAPLLVSAAGALLWLALPRRPAAPAQPAVPPTAARANVDVDVDTNVDGDVAGRPAAGLNPEASAAPRPRTSGPTPGVTGGARIQEHALGAAPSTAPAPSVSRGERTWAPLDFARGDRGGPSTSLGVTGGLPPTGSAAPDTLAEEARLLSLALSQLRKGHDAPAAVRTLEEHRARFPSGLLAREVKVALAEALRSAGRTEALLALLAQLEAEGFSTYPRGSALQLLFAQVNAEQGRCAAALQRLEGLPGEQTGEEASAAEDVRARCAAP